MTKTGNQNEHNPTHRLLQLIRGKDHSQAGTGWSQSPAALASKPIVTPLVTPRRINQVGIEIADGQLKIAGTTTGKQERKVYLWQVHDFPYTLQSDNVADRLRALLSSTLSQHDKLPGRPASFWATYEFSREEFYALTLPAMKSKDLPTALRWALKRHHDADVDHSYLDFEVLGEVVENNVRKIQVLAVLVAQDEVVKLEHAFSQAGYPLSGITTSSLACLNLFRSQCLTSIVPHIGLVHIGRENSRINILNHTRLILHRKIRTGLASILEDATGSVIQPDISAQDHEAEQQELSPEEQILDMLLTPDGQSPSSNAQDILTDIEPGIERLVRQVERTMSYYTRNMGNEPVQRVYLSGKLSASTHVQKQFAQALDVDIKPLDGFAGNISLSTPQPASLAQRLNLTPVLGLSLSSSEQTINFLNTYTQKAKHKNMLQVRRAGIVAVSCLLVLMAGYHVWQQVQLNAQKSLVQEKQSQARQLQSRMNTLKNQVVALQNKQATKSPNNILQRIEAKHNFWRDYADRFGPLAYAREIFSLLPDNAHLQEVFAYLQNAGPKVSLTMDTGSTGASERILYSDLNAGISLRQARPPRNTQSGKTLTNVLVLKGLLTGPERTKSLLLSQLAKRINASPFFHVWNSIAQEHISPSLGRAIQFHFLVKVN